MADYTRTQLEQMPADAVASIMLQIANDVMDELIYADYNAQIEYILRYQKDEAEFAVIKKTREGIYKYLDCSTGHVTEADMKLLDKNPRDWPVVSMSYPEGAWVYTHLYAEEIEGTEDKLRNRGYSAGFINVLRFARKHDCKYVCFDCDGETYEELERFEW